MTFASDLRRRDSVIAMRAVPLVLLATGCNVTIADSDELYSNGFDHQVLCGLSVDDKNAVSQDALAAGLDRAQVEQLTLHLYTHTPRGTVQYSTVESVVASAAARGLPFVTYREIVAGYTGAGLAFSFDDNDLGGWVTLRDIFLLYEAKATFFISGFHTLGELERAQLRQFADDGHDIQYHSTNHENAEDYSGANGVDRYVTDDILPDLAEMRAAGYDPTVFAYPYGARTADTDRALLDHFTALRAIRYTCPY